MTWTYDLTLLTATSSTGSLMKVRRMIGDIDTTRQQLSDEEIYYVLASQTSPTLAAATSCDLLAAQYAFQVNTENSELRVSAAARHKHYLSLADRLRAGGPGDVPGDANVLEATMYVGGAIHSQTEARALDTDLAQPELAVGRDDDPGSTDETRFVYGEDD